MTDKQLLVSAVEPHYGSFFVCYFLILSCFVINLYMFKIKKLEVTESNRQFPPKREPVFFTPNQSLEVHELDMVVVRGSLLSHT
jgi:hypothetical protein